METSVGAPAAGAGAKTNAAWRRRAQRERQQSRHVAWLVSMVQSGKAHHTAAAPAGAKMATEQKYEGQFIDKLVARIAVLEHTVEELSARLQGDGQADAGGRETTGEGEVTKETRTNEEAAEDEEELQAGTRAAGAVPALGDVVHTRDANITKLKVKDQQGRVWQFAIRKHSFTEVHA